MNQAETEEQLPEKGAITDKMAKEQTQVTMWFVKSKDSKES